eukprot:TRINITY_DN4380_c0_g1_i3.p1 TRINITY_DN4380_c0_g1~~TRINITY_DN4380_c0_g1_i3.p1  ORF type:complete len:583 (+),score=74.74 TRINITY_DN4380_c0_g1_i3:162-1910(+)
MGTQLTSAFNVSEEVVRGGPGNIWKIHKASKKSNGLDISLFVLEKSPLDSSTTGEKILAPLRKEAKTLSRLRHPSILRIVEPLEEDAKLLCFGTEPVEGSLQYLIDTPSKHTLIPSELELKTQILELINAVIFLHNNAHMLHLAISPENIYLTAEGKFKLSGFCFAKELPTTSSAVAPNLDLNAAILAPPLHFTAPEILRDNAAFPASDAFSIGSLIYSLLQVASTGKAGCFFDIRDSTSKRAYLEEAQRMTAGRVQAKLASYSETTANLLQLLLVCEKGERMGLQSASEHEWFNDPKVKTLEYLDRLSEKENCHKVQFLDGLGNTLNEFDSKVLLRRVLPKLAACLTIDKLSAHVLPAIISILKKESVCSKLNFYNIVWPSMRQLCKGKEITAQSLYLIIANTEVWMKYIAMQDFQSIVLLLYQKGIDCGISRIQEKAVEIIPSFAKKIEYATLKNTLLPKVLNLAANTTEGKLRVKCIESIASFSTVLDSTTIKESVLPLLDKLSKTNTSGKLHLVMVRTIESFIKIFSYEELANRVIPLLLSMSVTGQFSKQQFSDIMSLVRMLIDMIDVSRSKVCACN